MGKVKMKRKSTRIDMTAMSDVTVLLLTFFMLTSTFLQKEPVTVVTPSSVSEIKVPDTDVVNVLVSPQGNVFLGATGSIAAGDDGIFWSTDTLRRVAIQLAVSDFNAKTGKRVQLTEPIIEEFAKMNMFGVPIERIPDFFSKNSGDRDDWLSGKNIGQGPLADVKVTDVGIPMTSISYTDQEGPKETNEFQIWMRAYHNAGSDMLTKAMKSGKGIAVKADHNSAYETVHDVLDNLQTIHMNRFSVMTSLKNLETE
ncbi:MAG: biopolymer transporter ExbD [Muribaculaceae bacterium]|nr:biopolymer transporter ExbD [Muribaculaceae bacterium]MDE6831873.1 biopolymer transporter ExbD [Muribaculaceae bacterium]